MDKNLMQLYSEMYQPTTSDEQPSVVTESEDKTAKKKGEKKAKKDGDSDDEVGGAFYADSTDFNKVFGDILSTIGEEFGEGAVDDTMGYEDDGNVMDGEDEQISVSKATIQSIIDQLQGLIGDIGFDDGADDGDLGDDDIPLESYGFDGAGQEHGGKGNYDGKARLLAQTDLVTTDGNIRKDKNKVAGTRPTKGNNGMGGHNGGQGNYDGKARLLTQTDLVTTDGNANKNKNKTGYGKKKGEDLY